MPITIRSGLIQVPPGGFPGQAGNPVGFAAAPGYPGSLTPSSGPFTSGTVNNPTIISFKDFDGVAGSTNIDANFIKFVGCRFQSNNTGGNNVSTGGTGAQNIVFSYCSFTPRTSLFTVPPGLSWPSAGAGNQTTTFVDGVNCINGNSGYQFSFHCHNVTDGPITLDHCDFWGFANAIDFTSHTAQMTVQDCWFHDARNANTLLDHTDGPGYLNNTTPPQNIKVDHCTVASVGTTQGIAFQGGTSGYNNIIVINNFLSGFNVLACMCNQGAATPVNTNLTFTDNVFGTDLPWVNSPLSVRPSEWVSASNSIWRRNKLRVLPGTSTIAGQQFSWVSSDDGKFLLPDTTLSTTDYAG